MKTGLYRGSGRWCCWRSCRWSWNGWLELELELVLELEQELMVKLEPVSEPVVLVLVLVVMVPAVGYHTIGSLPIERRYSLAREKWRQPKNPR